MKRRGRKRKGEEIEEVEGEIRSRRKFYVEAKRSRER
jgi:hypothetical protein